MVTKGGSGTGKGEDRKARLAEELRANLQRRKAQARSRRGGDADSRPEGIAAAKQNAPVHKKDGIG
ncbi:MAG: hypothetical protein ACTHLP_14880 [Rhizobiaceae bacterium]|jgi:hypothetical protein